MNKNHSKIDNLGAALLFKIKLGIYLVKPENFKEVSSIFHRIMGAWDVFVGKRCAVYWAETSKIGTELRTKFNMCKNPNCPNGRRAGSAYCEECSIDAKKYENSKKS